MREWTEQEEQEMIELAKQGDPRANYELSLWALRRSEEEPEESRWNRLAAKCLVKAAQAGYPPAQARMAELLDQSGDKPKGRPTARTEPPAEKPAPREPVRLSDARAAAEARRGRGPAPESTARRPRRTEPEPVDEPPLEEDEDEDDYGRGRRAGRRQPARRTAYQRQDRRDRYDDEDERGYEDEEEDDGETVGVFSRWGEKQWRRVEIICVVVCAVLLVLIAVMILTSRGGSTGGQVNPTVPVAGDATGGTTTGDSAGGGTDLAATPEPAQYPDDATLAAIQAAELDVHPEQSDYVTVPTTATVKVDSQTLRLRTGPSTTYVPPICNMADGTVVQVYAIKNNWSLVYYEGGEDGPVYGWCSSEYLIVTSGAADNSSVG